MNYYIVGLCSFQEDIKLRKVLANNKLMAMCFAVREQYGWNVILENGGKIPFNTTDEAIEYFLQGDINISEPMELK